MNVLKEINDMKETKKIIILLILSAIKNINLRKILYW